VCSTPALVSAGIAGILLASSSCRHGKSDKQHENTDCAGTSHAKKPEHEFEDGFPLAELDRETEQVGRDPDVAH
jgi:hypothetical protein